MAIGRPEQPARAAPFVGSSRWREEVCSSTAPKWLSRCESSLQKSFFYVLRSVMRPDSTSVGSRTARLYLAKSRGMSAEHTAADTRAHQRQVPDAEVAAATHLGEPLGQAGRAGRPPPVQQRLRWLHPWMAHGQRRKMDVPFPEK